MRGATLPTSAHRRTRDAPPRRDHATPRHREGAGQTTRVVRSLRARRGSVPRHLPAQTLRAARSRDLPSRTTTQHRSHLLYGSPRPMVPARYICSASTRRAISCGRVHGANASLVRAAVSTAADSPNAPPTTNATSLARSRSPCNQPANPNESQLLPPGSHATRWAPAGTAFNNRSPSRSRTRSGAPALAGSSRTSIAAKGQ